MISLRDYQASIIEDARKAMARNKRVLIQAPTGAGKTVLASFMLDSAARKKNRCWFICHRQELVEGTANTFDKCGIPYGVVAAGFPPNPFAQIQICSIQTLANRINKLPPPTFVVWDECHHLGAASWDRVLNAFPMAWHIGLSATPQRLDGKGLGRWFQTMVLGPSVRWLIDNGHLSDYRLIAPGAPDLSGVHSRGGDYVAAELDEIMRGKAIIGGIVKHWLKHARGKKTIGFAPSIKSSEEYVAAFRQAGVMAVHLDGKMSRQDRRLAGMAFARGEIQILWNVDLFGEGFDLASLSGEDVSVEAVILARPTQSVGLHLQQVGRALRKKPTPAIILDHAGNTGMNVNGEFVVKHGLPDDEREWSLADREKKKKGDEEAVFAIKSCPKCFNIQRPGPPRCANCGHVFEIKHRQIETIEDDLAEVDVSEIRRNRLREQAQANTLEDLIELGRRRNYKHPEKWAAHLITARMAGRG